MLQIEDYRTAYDNLFTVVRTKKLVSQAIQKVIVKPDLRQVETEMLPVLHISKSARREESLATIQPNSSTAVQIPLISKQTFQEVNSPRGTKTFEVPNSPKSPTSEAKGAISPRNDMLNQSLLGTVIPPGSPKVRSIRTEKSWNVFRSTSGELKAPRKQSSPDISRRLTIASKQQLQSNRLAQHSPEHIILQSYDEQLLEADQQTQMKPQDLEAYVTYIKRYGKTTEDFLQHDLDPVTRNRLLSFEQFGFFDKEKKDPLFRKQLNFIRKAGPDGKISSTDLWQESYHLTMVKSSYLQAPRRKFLNYCLRSSAGNTTKSPVVPQIRQRDEQIKGILKVKARETRAQEGEYNKVTNKIKHKYIKIIMHDRGHDISLKNPSKTDKDITSPLLRSPSTKASTLGGGFRSTMGSEPDVMSPRNQQLSLLKAKGAGVLSSLEVLHKQVAFEKKLFEEQILIKQVNEANKRYQIIYGDGLGEASILG